jgi:hypothetical protein
MFFVSQVSLVMRWVELFNGFEYLWKVAYNRRLDKFEDPSYDMGSVH